MALAAAIVVDALAARLAAQAAVSGRVKTSRTWPWSEADLPACRVFAADERVEPTDVAGTINQHTLLVEAQYTARAVADLDDVLHALAASGLALLFAPPAPYGLQLTSISRSLATEGEAAVGVITLQVAATFFVNPAAPETIL
jgi:hypothetical protein